jgi:chromate reductase
MRGARAHGGLRLAEAFPGIGADGRKPRHFVLSQEDTMTAYRVGFIVGSLSSTSINRQLARALASLAPPALQFTEVPIAELPLYSQDHDPDYPPVARAFKQAIVDADAVVIVTPEYNRSIPGGLKNAIDWASRPWGTNAFNGKPVAIIGASVGAIGTAVAQSHLRGVLSFSNATLMNQVEAYIQLKPGAIGADGSVADEGLKQVLQKYLEALQQFVARTVAKPASGH